MHSWSHRRVGGDEFSMSAPGTLGLNSMRLIGPLKPVALGRMVRVLSGPVLATLRGRRAIAVHYGSHSSSCHRDNY